MTTSEAVPPAPEPTEAAPARASLARNTTALFISQSVTWVLAIVGTSIQPRFLGPEAVGQLRLAAAIWTMGAVVFAFGANTVVTVGLARDHRESALVGRAVGLQMCLFAVVAAGVIGYSFVASYSNELIIVIALTGVVTSLSIVSGPVFAAFTGLEQMAARAIADIMNKVITTTLLVIILVAGFGANVVVAVGLVGATLSLAWITLRLRRTLPSGSLRPRVEGARRLMHDGVHFFVNDVTLVVYLQVDTVIISLLATDTEIGWYSTADTLFGALLFVPTIVTTALFPVLARLGSESSDALAGLIRRSFGFVMLLAIPIGFGTFAIATPVCRLIFGEEFAESGPVLGTYGLVLLLSFPTVLLGRVALATGRERIWARLMVIATVVSIPVDIVLVPWTHRRYGNGAIGGALAYIVTEAIILVPALKLVAPQLLSRAVAGRLVRTLVAGGAMLAVAWPLRERFLLVPVVAGAAVYTVLVAVMRILEPEELRILQRGWSRVRRRSAASEG